jgi:hypothetical protein
MWKLVTGSLLAAGGVAYFVLGAQTVEEPPYKVLKSEGSIELREYAPYFIAKTSIAGSYRQSTKEGFNRLAGYIFGSNTTKTSLAMTAPVTQERTSEKLAMTAPVTQEQQGENWVMTFTMPAGYTLESLPTPLDSRVTLEAVPGHLEVVYRFSGTFSDAELPAHSTTLLAWAQQSGYRPISSARLAGYNPPWTPPFMRRNEVQIAVVPL